MLLPHPFTRSFVKMSTSTPVEAERSQDQRCVSCLSFRTGMKILFGSQFIWTGEYNTFNDGGLITRSIPVIIFCTILSFIAVLLTGFYLFREDTIRSRLGLVVSSGTLLAIAVIFVIGGVPIMWIDILFMTYYSVKRTWEEYQSLKL